VLGRQAPGVCVRAESAGSVDRSNERTRVSVRCGIVFNLADCPASLLEFFLALLDLDEGGSVPCLCQREFAQFRADDLGRRAHGRGTDLLLQARDQPHPSCEIRL